MPGGIVQHDFQGILPHAIDINLLHCFREPQVDRPCLPSKLRNHRGSISLGYKLPFNIGLQDRGIVDVGDRDGERVAIEHDQVGQLAFFY